MRRHRVWGVVGSLALAVPLAGCVSVAPDVLTVKSTAPVGHDPEALRVSLAMAATLEKTGEEAEAIRLYEKARAAEPKLASHRLALLHQRLGQGEQALREFRKALELAPRDADLLADLGQCLYAQGEFAEAEKSLRLALSYNGKQPQAWLTLGLTLGAKGELDGSVAAFEKAVGPAEAHYRLGVLLTERDRNIEAKAAFREALIHEPEHAGAKEALSRLAPPAAKAAPRGEASRAPSADRPQLPPQAIINDATTDDAVSAALTELSSAKRPRR